MASSEIRSTQGVGHTPGPWATLRDAVPEGITQVTVYSDTTGDRIATVFDEQAVPLIAAAPDLLEAARRCVEDLLLWRGDEPAQTLRLYLTEAAEELRAAIAKAEGGAS